MSVDGPLLDGKMLKMDSDQEWGSMKRVGRDDDARAQLLREAWIGDAVLSLYARLKILREDGGVDAVKCARMTSNQFLGTMGEPTKVEAEIGRIYGREGLEAAFTWIEAHIVPLFEKQEANRLRKAGVRAKGC